MTPEVFFRSVMGWMSSHPDHQKRRRRWFQGLALVPLAVIVLLGIALALDLENWLRLIRGTRFWLTAIVCSLAFASGALITLALCARWAELQKRGKTDVRIEAPPFLDQSFIFIAVVLGLVLPALALSPFSRYLPNAIILSFHVFAVLPLIQHLKLYLF